MKSSRTLSLIAAGVASALASSAFALSPAVTGAIPAAQVFYAGGGSAQVNAVLVATSSLLNNVDYFTDDAGGKNSSSFLALSGSLKAALGTLPAGSNILFIYRFAGGSLPNGALPQVGTRSTLVYPSQAQLAAAASTGTAFPLPSFKYTGAAATVGQPDFGVTDVEVPMFNYTDNLNGSPTLTATQLASIQQTGVYDNLFGVAVTNTVYANKTNFKKVELEGILEGTIQDWSQLFGDNGAPLAAGPIFLLDRGSGSGTKASGNQYFLGYPGSLTAAETGAREPGSAVNGYYTVGTNTGAPLNLAAGVYEDVKEGSSGAIVADLQTANQAGARAITILGLEFPPALNQVKVGGVGQNQYSFVKINGVGPDSGYDSTTVVSPITGKFHDNINDADGNDTNGHPFGTSYSNVVNGSYDFFYQNSFNTNAHLAGNNLTLVNLIKAKLSVPGISAAASGLAFPSSVPGLLLDPSTIGSQTAGVVLGTRAKTSTAPLQSFFDASNGPIIYGFDPL